MKAVGTVVAAFGRHYEIELDQGGRLTGFPRGKKSPYACGDRVELTSSGADQARITAHLPRTSLLYRSDEYRQKLIAANATQLVLVVATEPNFSEELLDRALVAAEHDDLGVVIVLNKCDLTDKLSAARAVLAPYQALGYPVVELCARNDVGPLRPFLAGQLSVLVGQSGMGKSTLINTLVPDAAAATREISAALDSGKHTTTHARLYRIDDDSRIIDSPGLQEFGLAHLDRHGIESGFREFRPHLGQCRFRDCHHRAEPDCALKNAVASAQISTRRLGSFLRICG
ncbi:ribosome small subunit-dependent GTPase A [Denitratisoma sp. DHT3]|uniref:ribosome small subunit-dependent GTPase A n=1 Tax=Denitratisoma sp. DHT3 TaxID=1981880 RepID=UPI001198587C|nr:ribosome small subunit-dependent GTPase A [Denitratisoma sp. DHT3]QDX81133.1 ribosome small subunit-dependent GTPase A [Denitratisoma sp. DHT3]